MAVGLHVEIEETEMCGLRGEQVDLLQSSKSPCLLINNSEVVRDLRRSPGSGRSRTL